MNIRKKIEKAIGIKNCQVQETPNLQLGDFSTNIAFQIAKQEGKNPKDVAEEIIKKIKTGGLIKEVKATGPYINFYLNKNKLANQAIKEAQSIKPAKKKNKTINLDIYGPNAMKGLHMGHVRNAALGGCLHRILEHAGYTVKTNSFGCDIGLPVAKVIWGYNNLGLKIEGEKGEWLGVIYQKASEKFNNDPKVQEETYEINKKIYDKNPEVMKTYNTLINWSQEYVKQMADKLRLKINKYIWESETIKPAEKAINQLIEKKIALESQGALIANLEKHNLGIYVLKTKQGVPTYEAKDLGLSIIKKELFNADKYVIFTGAEQIMHFKQLIKTLELMNFKKNTIIHKPYELVLVEGKKISSRAGAVVMTELLNELITESMNEIAQKNTKLSKTKQKEIAQEIAISSIMYGMIKQDMTKTINFNIKDWIKFDGDTGAYIQYNYVRAKKIISETKQENKKKIEITHDTEYELIKKISKFSEAVNQASNKMDTSIIAKNAYELANTFSKFYEQCPIIKNGINNTRLEITKAYEKTLKKYMELMGMQPLSEM